MRTFALLIFLVAGCDDENPIATCEIHWSDCCESDDHCAAWYNDAPYCAFGGVCVQCVTDTDCPLTGSGFVATRQVCQTDPGVCVPAVDDAR